MPRLIPPTLTLKAINCFDIVRCIRIAKWNVLIAAVISKLQKPGYRRRLNQ